MNCEWADGIPAPFMRAPVGRGWRMTRLSTWLNASFAS